MWMNISDFLMSPFVPRCVPAWGQEAGPQCPNVPLPAPEAADALPGEVSHPLSPNTLIFPEHVCLSPAPLVSRPLPALSGSSNLRYPLNIL